MTRCVHVRKQKPMHHLGDLEPNISEDGLEVCILIEKQQILFMLKVVDSYSDWDEIERGRKSNECRFEWDTQNILAND